MSDILVVKVNMFCRSRELNDIRRYILSQIENGKVVVTACLLRCSELFRVI